MINTIKNIYSATVLRKPVLVCFFMSVVLSFFAIQTKNFKLDASADSLLLEDDEDLKLFRETSERYTTKEFLFVTFTPKDSLFSKSILEKITQLRNEIKEIKLVDSVISLVDVPLVRQFNGSLSDVADNVRTIEGGDVNLEKAKQELLTSPIYKELVIKFPSNNFFANFLIIFEVIVMILFLFP